MNQNHLNITQAYWLVLIAFMVALIARRIKAPYALVLVITGLILGISRLLPQVRLEPAILFTVFLPPLLFEAAINLRLEALKQDWKPIAIYTLGGTLLSTFIVGGLLSLVLRMPLPVGLVFGALISATDPIAVIGIFKRLGAGKRLTTIIEAESLFNDGVAVVLFTVMLTLAAGGKASIGNGLWEFTRLMAGGVVLGAGIGALASRVHYDLDDHLIEITLTTVVAFGAYLFAEALHVSGVMAVVAAGLVIGNFGMQTAMTPGTRLAVTAFWEYAGFVVNSIVFLLVGIEVSSVRWSDKAGIVVLAIVSVLAGRAVIYPLSVVVNRFKGEIPRAWQHILFWGGLRGALSMALALGLSRDFAQRETLIAATFGVVLFSLLGQGMTLGSLLKHLQVTGSDTAAIPNGAARLLSEAMACSAVLLELERMKLLEATPNWSWELLVRNYRERLEQTEASLEKLMPNFRDHQTLQAIQAKRLTLLAEKSAFQESERAGWLDEVDWQQIARRIDAELLDLERGTPHGENRTE